MNFTLMPSLQERSLAALAVALWNHRDCMVLLSRINAPVFKRELQEVFDIVLEKVRKFCLPEMLKKELSRYVDVVGWQMFRMKKYRKVGFSDFGKLCWTPQCTVDRKKTAELLIKEATLGTCERYDLACDNCLEDYIYPLWEEMQTFCKEVECFEKDKPFLFHWTHYLEREMTHDVTCQIFLDIIRSQSRNSSMTPNERAFLYSVMIGNEAANEYFFRKLTPQGKERALVEIVRLVIISRRLCLSINDPAALPIDRNYTDILCFLLSNMDKQQQIKLFKTINVLVCLLDWPWQSLLVETVKGMSDFISEADFHSLLKEVVAKVKLHYKDWNYKILLRELWLQIPVAHKKYVIGKSASCGSLLLDLIEIEDKENIKLILEYATVEEKEKIVFSVFAKIGSNRIFQNCDTLIFFIKKCMLSRDKMIELRERLGLIGRNFRPYRNLESKDLKRIRLNIINFLGGIINKGGRKRSMKRRSSGPSKRLHQNF